MISNNVYYFSSGTSWVVPDGVTGIQVECYGSSYGATATSTVLNGNYSGGSYSKSNVTVTGGSTVYMNIGSLGGNTWFNTTNAAPTSSSSTSSACLAVGGNTNSYSQIDANCGDVKYKGGDGLDITSLSSYTTASGGQAGPNGNGASVQCYYTLDYLNGKVSLMGGGANGGSSGSAFGGVPPYGRSGTGTVGSGAYWNGTTIINAPFTSGGGFIDPVGQYSYRNNLLNLSTLVDYGPTGGSIVIFSPGGDCPDIYSLQAQQGFIVITLVYGRKFIVVNTTGSSSFTAPSDFSSLVSVEAVGAGGNGDASTSGTARYGGGGGGGYSKSTSVTTSITAGTTTIYTSVAAAGGGTTASSWLNVAGSSAPTSNTTGVLAYSGGNASTNTGGAGATTTGAYGTTGSIFGGGAGGLGSTTSRLNAGGGGGSGGPLGAGGAGGAANNNGVNRGGGGGGGANYGAAGGAANTVTPYVSGNGGTGSSAAGGGGTGNSAAAPSSTGSGTSGPSGGGGGGGSGFSYGNVATGGAVNNSVYQIGGGTGGNSTPRANGSSLSAWPGAGGGGNSTSGSNIGGTGLVVFAYTPNAAPIANGNFLAFF
jgi:hypothetical protein